MRYARNRIYISEKEQETIKNHKIFVAGCGIGSVIAECALRLGFENITIADGDVVEISNLNRQNYSTYDVGSPKVMSLKKRLESVNPLANITACNFELTNYNIEPALAGHHIAINALDFQSNTPFIFDDFCRQRGIPVLHPYNVGWAALLFIITPDSPKLSAITENFDGFEKVVVNFFLEEEKKRSHFRGKWIEEVLVKYEAETPKLTPPQLSVASWLLGGLCTEVLFNLATNGDIKEFPDYYFV